MAADVINYSNVLWGPDQVTKLSHHTFEFHLLAEMERVLCSKTIPQLGCVCMYLGRPCSAARPWVIHFHSFITRVFFP